MKVLIILPYGIEQSGLIVFAERLEKEFTLQGVIVKLVIMNLDSPPASISKLNNPVQDLLYSILSEEQITFDVIFWFGLYQSDENITAQLQASAFFCTYPGNRTFILWERTGVSPALSLDSFHRALIQRGVHGIIVLNDEQKNGLIRQSLPASLIHTLSPGVDTRSEFRPVKSRLERAGLRKKFRWPLELPVALSFGRFTKGKRTDLLLDTWLSDSNLNKRARLVLFGSGFGQPDSVEDQVYRLARKNSSISIVPYQPNINRALFYRAADFIIQLGMAEGEPTVLSEAMASGLPVLASNIAGHKYLVRPEQTGILVDPDNKPELIAALHKLISDGSYRRRMGRIARKVATTERDISSISKKLLSIFSKTV